MGAVQKIKNCAGIGETALAKVNRQMRELRLEYPEMVKKNWQVADKIARQIAWDNQFRNEQLSIEERALNQKLGAEVNEILKIKQIADESFEARKTNCGRKNAKSKIRSTVGGQDGII